jgi:hypothetical protein
MTIDPAINLKQNPPSSLEYPKFGDDRSYANERRTLSLRRVGFDLDILVIAQRF